MKVKDLARAAWYLANYWAGYTSQPGWKEYSDETFLNDALYGIGCAVDFEKYYGAEGFKQFKKDLQKYLFKDELKHIDERSNYAKR